MKPSSVSKQNSSAENIFSLNQDPRSENILNIRGRAQTAMNELGYGKQYSPKQKPMYSMFCADKRWLKQAKRKFQIQKKINQFTQLNGIRSRDSISRRIKTRPCRALFTDIIKVKRK